MQKDDLDAAMRWLSDTAAIETLRVLSPKSDQELERLYWNGYNDIPGSVVAALYPLIKRNAALDSTALAKIACGDEERARLLAKNLRWEADR